MIKLAFYLDNSSIPNADLRYPELGNPGIGGTQFYFVALPYYINKFFPNKYEITIYAHYTDRLPASLNTSVVSSVTDIISFKSKIDFFIFRPKFNSEYYNFYKDLDNYSIKSIVWAHNMLKNKELNIFCSFKCFVSYVCVSKEQLHRICDHDIFKKSTFIFNPFDLTNYSAFNSQHRNNVVTYIGAIIKSKGFHKLAKIWPEILLKVKDAELHVIGSGNLYNESSILGKWGIAEESYEKIIRKYLSDKDGNIIPSVKFYGKLGHKKKEIFKKSKVGIANPTGVSENCPGSALEFQACGIPVVSANRFGLLDTVVHGKTGLLYNRSYNQKNAIIKLLNCNKLNSEYGKNAREFVSLNFNPVLISSKWDDLFEDLIKGNFHNKHIISNNLFHNFKFLRIWNRKLRDLNISFFSLLIFQDFKAYIKKYF